jgi:hypothetical protein
LLKAPDFLSNFVPNFFKLAGAFDNLNLHVCAQSR